MTDAEAIEVLSSYPVWDYYEGEQSELQGLAIRHAIAAIQTAQERDRRLGEIRELAEKWCIPTDSIRKIIELASGGKHT